MNGKIAEPEYIEWAMTNFDLPSVSGDFFTTPPDLNFWNRVKNLYSWKPNFLPLTEWEGVLLIACIEPPSEFKFALPHQFVLASARHLLLLWGHLNSTENQNISPNVSRKVSPFEPNAENKNEDPFENKTLLSEGPRTSFNPEFKSESSPFTSGFDLPDGFVLNSTAVKPALEIKEVQDSNEDTSSSRVVDLSESSRAAPDGLKLNPNPKPKPNPIEFAAKVEPPSEALSNQPVLNGTQSFDAIGSLNLPDGNTISDKTHILSNATTTKNVTKMSEKVSRNSAENSSEKKPSLDQHVPKAAASIRSKSSLEAGSQSEDSEEDGHGDKIREVTSFTMTDINSKPIESARDVKELGAIALIHILKNFEGAMFLKMEGDKLKPWKWSGFLTTPNNATFKTADLTSPSIFRIVHRSLLPFHGQVSPSTVNDAFFAAFSSTGKSPAHVTLAPLINKKICTGMILGVSTKPVSYKSVLPTFERLADEIAQTLNKVNSSAAA